ncbi:MAG TPA: type I restriction enzyme HsdR N-terminal domain-containing protein, partial [Bacteroidales bacterium]|nr:type I restriction enzyme HsdR N-terminal domain-containing protein [Bacteroidales bacterium]
NEGGYPPGLIGVEVKSRFSNLNRRVDILIHDRTGAPVMIVECKSPEITLNDKVFDQIVCYNLGFRVPYLIVTNGLVHYACRIDIENNKYEFLHVIPLYKDL